MTGPWRPPGPGALCRQEGAAATGGEAGGLRADGACLHGEQEATALGSRGHPLPLAHSKGLQATVTPVTSQGQGPQRGPTAS